MIIRIKPRRPIEDALVEDAVPAKADETVLSREAIIAAWKDIPGPTAKRKPCAHCGGQFYRPCHDHEHAGCLNFQVTQQRQKKEAKK